ncbi:hypothetical protein [Aneurinibacillus migulanus]|uniref:hypothetical protein n=1 Tax=Aneurinibacillus migulanus TaxID=47500 RepID=UPI000696A8A5|nr:hypothetical protein [Aneurinibacillus migulanus]
MSQIRYTAEEICAKLTTKSCNKEMFPQLEYDDRLRNEVKESLNKAGYQFVDDPISKHYDARIKPQIRSIQELVENELGGDLTVQAKALIVILWCHLILPKFDRAIKKELTEEPTVTEEQLYENFKQHIGARQNLRRSLTLLRQYNFIKTVWGQKNTIAAGPRLTTAIDSMTMYDLVRENILNFLIIENEDSKQELEKELKNLKEADEDGGNLYANTN